MFQVHGYVEVVLSKEERFDGTIRYADNQKIAILYNHGGAANIPAGTRVQLLQAAEEGLYQIITVAIGYQENCLVVAARPPELVQRRRNARTTCQLPACCIDLTAPIGSRERALALIRDIGLGGVKAYVKQPYAQHVIFDMVIQLTASETLCTQAQVARCSPLQGAEGEKFRELPFALALQFTELSRAHQVQLRQFLTHAFRQKDLPT